MVRGQKNGRVIALVLHMEYGGENNSTFRIRVILSCSDIFSDVTIV
jgi:citrate synthase